MNDSENFVLVLGIIKIVVIEGDNKTNKEEGLTERKNENLKDYK